MTTRLITGPPPEPTPVEIQKGVTYLLSLAPFATWVKVAGQHGRLPWPYLFDLSEQNAIHERSQRDPAQKEP